MTMQTVQHASGVYAPPRFQGTQPAPAKKVEPEVKANQDQPADILKPSEFKPSSPIIGQLSKIGYQLFDVPRGKEQVFMASLLQATQKAHLSGIALFHHTSDSAKIEAGTRKIVQGFFSDLQGAGYKIVDKPDMQAFLERMLPAVQPKLVQFLQDFLVPLPGDKYGVQLKKGGIKSIVEKTWEAVPQSDKDHFAKLMKDALAKVLIPVPTLKNNQTKPDFNAAFDQAGAKMMDAFKALVAETQNPNDVADKVDRAVKGFFKDMGDAGFVPTRKMDVQQFVEDLAAAKLFILPKLYKSLKEDAKFGFTEKPLRMLAVSEIDEKLRFISEVDPSALPKPPETETPGSVDFNLPWLKQREGQKGNKLQGLARRAMGELVRFVVYTTASVSIMLGIQSCSSNKPPEPVSSPPAIERKVDVRDQMPPGPTPPVNQQK